MATASKPHNTAADTSAAVDALMAELVHPCKAEVQALRQLILSAAQGIAEGVKWKAPSFRTHEYFVTINLREKQGVGVILHLGAKVRALGPGGLAIEDPAKLLKWLAPDRAQVQFSSAADLAAKADAFKALVKSWVLQV